MSGQQVASLPGGNDRDALRFLEANQVALVTGDEVVGFSGDRRGNKINELTKILVSRRIRT